MREVGGTPMDSRKKSHTYPEGRVCSDSDCKTILSRYNESDRCMVHMHRGTIRTRGKK